MPEKECLISGCVKPIKARGVCKDHYNEWYSGKPGIVSELGPFQVVRPHKMQAKSDESKDEQTKTEDPGKVELPLEDIINATPDELTLKITDYPDILPCLEEAAKINIRTIAHQALYYIIKGLKDGGFVKPEDIKLI